jgi:AraC-like DNA-binding protein
VIAERAYKRKMSERTLKLIIARSKLGHSLSQISEQSGLTIEEVKETLGQATGLTPKDIVVIFHMKQRGLTLEQINQEFDVELEVLKQFLTDAQVITPVIKESVVEFETQIEALLDHALRLREIGRRLAINDRAVLAYSQGSPDDSKTSFSEATERSSVNYMPSPTTSEETKEPQQPQPPKTLPKHQQSQTTFFYCCDDYTKKLHWVNLLTGEKTCNEVPSELPGGSLLTGGGHDAVRVVEKLDVGTFGPAMPIHKQTAS